jgi:hypothetical protein
MQPQSANTPEPFPHESVPPDLLAWARQTFDEREYLEGVQEIEASGGRTFDELIAEVEARLRGHE